MVLGFCSFWELLFVGRKTEMDRVGASAVNVKSGDVEFLCWSKRRRPFGRDFSCDANWDISTGVSILLIF